MSAKGDLIEKLYIVDGICEVEELAERANLSVSHARVCLNDAREKLRKNTELQLNPAIGMTLSEKALDTANTHLEQMEKQHDDVMDALAMAEAGSITYRDLLNSSVKLKREIQRITGVDDLITIRSKNVLEEHKPKKVKEAPKVDYDKLFGVIPEG